MKKLISVLLSVILLISSLCINVGAQTDSSEIYDTYSAEKSVEFIKQINEKNILEKTKKNISNKQIYAVSISDINNHWSKNEVLTLVNMGIINGYPDGTFKPDNTITRAEFTKIIIETMMSAGGFEYSTATNTFADVKADEWFAKQVETAYKYGIVNGVDDKNFDPEGLITREAAAKIITSVFMKLCGFSLDYMPNMPKVDLTNSNFRDVDKISSWAYDYMAVAVYYEFMKGSDNLLNPADPMTRAEASAVIYRLFELNKEPAAITKMKVSDYFEFLNLWFEYNEYDFRIKSNVYNEKTDTYTVIFNNDTEYAKIGNCSYSMAYTVEMINGEQYIKAVSLYNRADNAMNQGDFYNFIMIKSGVFSGVTANTGIKLYDDIFITNSLKFTESFDVNCFKSVSTNFNYKNIFNAYYDSVAPSAENTSTSAVLSVFFA